MMTETIGRVFTVTVGSITELRLQVLNSPAEQQLCDSEFKIEGALLLKVLAYNKSAILGTDSNTVSADRSVHSGSIPELNVKNLSVYNTV